MTAAYLDLFDAESIKKDINKEKEMEMNEDQMPVYGSEKWNDFVMSKFHKYLSPFFQSFPFSWPIRAGSNRS